MGNQALKTAFKAHLKNEVAEDVVLHMNAEFLFLEKHLIHLIYEKVKKEKLAKTPGNAAVTMDFDLENFLKENNNQVNSHCEDILHKKLIAEIH